MIFDAKQKKWVKASAWAAAAAFLVYLSSWLMSRNGPRGGSPIGILFGAAGASIFIFECLLKLRKKFGTSKVVVARTGSLPDWVRAHIWLGLLSFLLALMHSGFRWGHGLAAALMWLLLIVVSSGLVGFALQNYLPRLMKERVERETIFDQIPGAILRLHQEASERVRLATGAEMGIESKKKLDAAWSQHIRPYLNDSPTIPSAELFSTSESIRKYFGDLRQTMPLRAHRIVVALEDICEERRQLRIQRKIHYWLHGWLLIHVPLSYGLLVLTLVHAVLSLKY